MRFLSIEKKIPAEIWLQAITPLLREGYQFKICPQGRSMVPFLQGGRDEAVLSAPDENYVYRKNDIVLFKSSNGIHVLHRICSISKKGIYTLGDGNTAKEGPFQREDILAVADYIIRKGKVLHNEDRTYILLVGVWRAIRPFRPFLIKSYTITKKLGQLLKKKNSTG